MGYAVDEHLAGHVEVSVHDGDGAVVTSIASMTGKEA